MLDKDGVFATKRKAPDPVCVALPDLPVGHYQFVLEASAVEDTAYCHPVRLTTPLDIL